MLHPEILQTPNKLSISRKVLEMQDKIKLKVMFITLNGLLDLIMVTGLKLQLQMILEQHLNPVLILLMMLLLNNKLSKPPVMLLLKLHRTNTPRRPSIRTLHPEMQEWIKPEVKLKIQETLEDGNLYGQSDH